MVHPEFGEIGSEIAVKILGEDYGATVIQESPFDPDNLRLRG
jgi:dimethylglycine dehydrogenase